MPDTFSKYLEKIVCFIFKMIARRQGGGNAGVLYMYVEGLTDAAHPACAGFTLQIDKHFSAAAL
jgi:hypothetical protein